jgi:hypothetical protein
MDKKLLISLGLAFVLSGVTSAVFADTTIYTDDLGRMHFLGRDAASNTGAKQNFSNSAEQDLTRKLYEQAESGVVNDTTYQQHPLKNYENTFPDSRFGTSNVWRTKYSNNENYGPENIRHSGKATVTATKGATDPSNPYIYGTTILNDADNNVKKTSTKKHWWNRK